MQVRFTEEEKRLLMLYFSETRTETANTLRQMQAYLMPDETVLRKESDELINKLFMISDEEFDSLGYFSELQI